MSTSTSASVSASASASASASVSASASASVSAPPSASAAPNQIQFLQNSGFHVTSRPQKQLSINAPTPIALNPSSNSFHHSPVSPSCSTHHLSSPTLPTILDPPELPEVEPRPPRIPNGSQVLVTLDIDAAYFVDLSNSSSPAAIKERIYAKLGIYDDDHANCRISRCRAGQPLGLPLDDWQLWDLCMRANQDADPPMLIVRSSNCTNPSPATTSASITPFALPPQNNFPSPDSASQLKLDSSSPTGRDSPDQLLRSSRPRWHRSCRDPPQHSPHARDSSSSSLGLAQPFSPADLRNHSLAPNPLPSLIQNHQSPISPCLPDDRRLSPISKTPLEMPAHLVPRTTSRVQFDSPDHWPRMPFIQPRPPPTPDDLAGYPTRHRRRPSEPVSAQPLPSASHPPPTSHSDQRLAEYARRPPPPNLINHPPQTLAIRRYPQPSPSSRRTDLQAAKSMEDLRLHSSSDSRKWAIPGLTHPPLPNGSPISKIPQGPSRAPPPLRIPRNEPQRLFQQASAPNRPSYPPSPSPNFPFPQPTIRPSRVPAPPGYGPPPASQPAPPRLDSRNTGPPMATRPGQSASLSSRNPRGSLQIENRYIDSARPMPRPRTGDASSPMRSGNLGGDRPVHQAPLAAQSHIQHAVSHSSLSIRPGDILQDSVGGPARHQRREMSREYRTDLEREPARRWPSNHSPTANPPPPPHRPNRPDDPVELRTPCSAPSGAPSARRVIGDVGPLVITRARPNRHSGSQTSSVKSSDSSSFMSLELSKAASNHDGYPGLGPDGPGRPAPKEQDRWAFGKEESEQEQLSSWQKIEDAPDGRLVVSALSLDDDEPAQVTPQPGARFCVAERGPGNAQGRFSDEGGNKVGEASPGEQLMRTSGVMQRGRSQTCMSASTSTLTTSANSSNPTTATLTSVTTPDLGKQMFGDLDDDEDEAVGTFVRPMEPYKPPGKGKEEMSEEEAQSGKPKLRVQTVGAVPEIQVSGRLESAVTKEGAPEGAQPAVGEDEGHLNLAGTSRASKRISFTGDDWAVRPGVDEVYENLEEFFPHHDLDKPIDIGPVPVDMNSPSSPMAPGGSGMNSSTSSAGSNVASGQGGGPGGGTRMLKGRTRSIRVVAQEKKRLLRRTEDKVRMASLNATGSDRMSGSGGLGPPGTLSGGGGGTGSKGVGQASGNPGSALLRRKSTKLWGARIEEVRPGDMVSVPKSIPESPVDDDVNNFSFKWVKGELIGKGSFGQVYLALNATNGEMLAVKQVELPKTYSDRDCERQKNVVAALKSEIHLMRDLEHPNIVQYLGFEETTVYLSIFLEYVPGGSIGRCLRRHGAFELNVIKSFTSQTLEGLRYLHGLHILHRDLKADNLLVDLSGSCKISDFGISKKSEHIYEDNTQMSLQGSIFWMAPEVVHNPNKKGYSAKVDIWSLGCVVLEMFAGRRPWSDEEAIQAMFKLGAERLRPPVPADVKLGRMSDHFLAQCFIVDPELRPTADRLTDHRFLELDDPNWRFEDSELYRSIKVPHTTSTSTSTSTTTKTTPSTNTSYSSTTGSMSGTNSCNESSSSIGSTATTTTTACLNISGNGSSKDHGISNHGSSGCSSTSGNTASGNTGSSSSSSNNTCT